jgi:hypothetical protein
MEAGVEIGRRVGRNQRQIARHCQRDQRILGRLLDRVAAAHQLDVEPVSEQLLETIEIGLRLGVLPIVKQPGDGALSPAGQRDQPVRETAKRVEGHVRVLRHGSVEVRRRNQTAEVRVAAVVLGQQHQPVERSRRVDLCRAGDRQKGADDRLHALRHAGVGERHRGIQAVAICQRSCRKAEPGTLGSDRLRLHRPFQHGEGRQVAQRHVRELSHSGTMRSLAALKSAPRDLSPVSRRRRPLSSWGATARP